MKSANLVIITFLRESLTIVSRVILIERSLMIKFSEIMLS